jgi:hypothetical protein
MANTINGVTQKIVLIVQPLKTRVACTLFSIFFSKVCCFPVGLRSHFSPISAKLSVGIKYANPVAAVKAIK